MADDLDQEQIMDLRQAGHEANQEALTTERLVRQRDAAIQRCSRVGDETEGGFVSDYTDTHERRQMLIDFKEEYLRKRDSELQADRDVFLRNLQEQEQKIDARILRRSLEGLL